MLGPSAVRLSDSGLRNKRWKGFGIEWHGFAKEQQPQHISCVACCLFLVPCSLSFAACCLFVVPYLSLLFACSTLCVSVYSRIVHMSRARFLFPLLQATQNKPDLP